MPPYNHSRRDKTWGSLFKEELLSPILEDHGNDEAPSSRKLCKNVLYGLPVGLIVPLGARPLGMLIVKITNNPSILDGSTFTIIVYAVGVIALIMNVAYLYSMVRGRTTSNVDATVGIMIGFCLSWVTLSLVVCGDLDVLPLSLLAAYGLAYWFVQKQREQGGYRNCPVV